jgi:hypothetical protein
MIGGIEFADGLALDLDPGVGGEGIGAHPGAPGGPAPLGAAVQRGGDGALQTALTGAAHADRNNSPPSGMGLLLSGGSGAAAGEFQHASELAGMQSDQQPSRTDGQQRQHAVVCRESMLVLQGEGDAHDEITSFAADSCSVRAVMSCWAC